MAIGNVMASELSRMMGKTTARMSTETMMAAESALKRGTLYELQALAGKLPGEAQSLQGMLIDHIAQKTGKPLEAEGKMLLKRYAFGKSPMEVASTLDKHPKDLGKLVATFGQKGSHREYGVALSPSASAFAASSAPRPASFVQHELMREKGHRMVPNTSAESFAYKRDSLQLSSRPASNGMSQQERQELADLLGEIASIGNPRAYDAGFKAAY